MSLAGKFFLHMGKEYLHHGEVVEVCGDAALIRRDHHPDCECPGKTMQLVPVAKMAAKFSANGSLESDWEFFATRAELDAFLRWLEMLPDDDEAATEEAPVPAAIN
jgi:hypothetical protein